MYIIYELKISIFLLEKFDFLKLYESARSQWTDMHPTFIQSLKHTHYRIPRLRMRTEA